MATKTILIPRCVPYGYRRRGKEENSTQKFSINYCNNEDECFVDFGDNPVCYLHESDLVLLLKVLRKHRKAMKEE